MTGISMNELTTYRWSFDEDVIRYSAVGIDAIGVWRQKLADFGEEKGNELLRDTQLAVSNLLWAGGFTGSDGRSYQESVDDAAEAIDLAADLGTNCLVVYSGGSNGHTKNHARRLLLGALKELAPMAREREVYLCIEPMHESCASDWTFLTDIDATLDVLDEVNDSHARDAVRMVFDTYHLAQDAAVLSRLDELAPRTAIVHVGDTKGTILGEQNRCPLGEGSLPLADVLARFTAAGYEGYFDVELMGEEIELADYDQLVRQSKAACDELLQAACA